MRGLFCLSWQSTATAILCQRYRSAFGWGVVADNRRSPVVSAERHLHIAPEHVDRRAAGDAVPDRLQLLPQIGHRGVVIDG